ncbi:hypothetical protein Q033_03898 [Pseudomonas aeruginosa BWHPSA020]|nr:hypothetical protein Q033_03898 [Pseudomonas aeruginosa BWHPSA020]
MSLPPNLGPRNGILSLTAQLRLLDHLIAFHLTNQLHSI